jgi:hypothetical protein
LVQDPFVVETRLGDAFLDDGKSYVSFQFPPCLLVSIGYMYGFIRT